MEEKAISIKNVKKKYCLYRRNIHRILEMLLPFGREYHTPFFALQDIDLEVIRGETVGIIGRNGSGKSTMLQLICGILQPTVGSVHINGRVSALLELGAGFNPEFSGRDNVYLSTSIMGLSKEETDQRFDKIVDFAEIGDFIDQPVKTYSSGMFVRLAFATAISVDPDILIIDEALAVGDIFFQQKCMKYMKKMMESNTIVLVSHDMHAVSSLCDRVIVMEAGRKLFDGETAEGIALYTRLVHNELFSREEATLSATVNIPEQIVKRICDDAPDFKQWITVDNDSRGGADDVIIHRVSVTKNREIFKTVEYGETITVRMLIWAKRPIDETIFGYTVKDRVGIALFGENTVSLLEKPLSVDSGFSLVTFDFQWPEVVSQDYTLTLGIGEGNHAFEHTIQCWAHSIFSFTAITPGRFIHGMFNNVIRSLTLTKIK
jgi:ABC-type polysaccharide/polyol phosphate transport system ATPase subunit